MTDLFSVTGRIALVTGGSRGIGDIFAVGFPRHGVRVYISSRDAGACEATATRLGADGDRAALPADLSTLGGVTDLAARLAQREDRLGILVDNAGATRGEPL